MFVTVGRLALTQKEEPAGRTPAIFLNKDAESRVTFPGTIPVKSKLPVPSNGPKNCSAQSSGKSPIGLNNSAPSKSSYDKNKLTSA